MDFSNESDVPKPARKRKGISQQNVYVSDDKEFVPFQPNLVRYNKYMGASDIIAQVWVYYTTSAHSHFVVGYLFSYSCWMPVWSMLTTAISY